MIYLIIYLIGYVLAFILARKQRKAIADELEWNTWGDIILTTMFSLLSWGLVIILLFIMTKLSKFKPPKWL